MSGGPVDDPHEGDEDANLVAASGDDVPGAAATDSPRSTLPAGATAYRSSASSASATLPSDVDDAAVDSSVTRSSTAVTPDERAADVDAPVVVADDSDGVDPGDGNTDDRDGHDDEDGAGDDASTEDHKKPRSFWRELPVLVVVALVLAFLIKSFLVQAFYIPSESMENTLLIGDRVLVNKLAYRIGDVERGDVIVFDGTDSFDVGTTTTDTGGNVVTRTIKKVASSFGLAPGSDNDYIKRVIGIGGDHVVCCDDKGRITVNGTALAPEDYLFPGDEPSNSPFDITVPDGRVWVMGDHRSRSEDSRAHLGNPGGGTVPVDHIVGRAFVIVWPFNRFDTMTRPADFDKIAAASP